MEEVSAAGWNASGRGGAAQGGGDSRLEAGTAARTRAAMPHFTVVPVDGPRRGDYDNLEGLSWVDYGERAEREDSDGEGAAGTGGVYTGPARAAGPRASTSMRDSTFLAPRALRPMSLLGPGLLSQVILHPPAPPAPPPRAAGGGCRRGRPGRPASRLPRSGWCRTRVPGPDQAQQKPGLQLPRFP